MCAFRQCKKHAKIFCLFMNIFRPFHNSTFQRYFYLQKSIAKLEAKDKNVCFAILFKIISKIRYTFPTSFYQRAGAKSLPKTFNNNLLLQVCTLFKQFCTFHDGKLNEVMRKAFQLFETDAESELCHLFVPEAC